MPRTLTVLIDGKEKTYSIRSLTGKEVRLLTAEKNTGFGETFRVLEMIGISQKESDCMAFSDCLKIQRAVNAETFGAEDEIKN